MTPPTADDQYWNWKANIAAGDAKLDPLFTGTGNTGQARGANKFWIDQVAQWSEYNDQHTGMEVPMQPPQSEGGGKCTFTYLPTGSQRDFRDAIWIKRWNGLGEKLPKAWSQRINSTGTIR